MGALGQNEVAWEGRASKADRGGAHDHRENAGDVDVGRMIRYSSSRCAIFPFVSNAHQRVRSARARA